MPSAKARDNKALVATCVACGKNFSPEAMVALAGRVEGRARPFPVCVACADGGWRPPGFDGIYGYRPS